jgi:chromosome segregation ATPase
MEKIRKTKTEIETAQKELQETHKYLHGYHDQWLGINALFKESPGKEFHPFDFGVLFNKLYTRTNEVADKCGQLERQLNETRQAFNTTSKELMIQVKQYETLGSESKSTKTSLLDLSSEKAKLECRVNDLESKLSAALQAKKEANDRLKTVTCRMIEYVQDDLFEF